MSDNRILVVGTTHDYIDYINRQYSDRAIFLTDESIQENLKEVIIDDKNIIISKLFDLDTSINSLHIHLNKYDQKLTGITCFDCEWLSLASKLGEYYKLPYPSEESIHLTRDKYLTKKKWIENNIPCPKMELVYDGWQTLKLIEKFNNPVVLKPLTGSGSELTFLCHDNSDLTTAYREIVSGLTNSKNKPLYNNYHMTSNKSELKKPILAEEYIEGIEYSADFIIDIEKIKLVRIARKIRSKKLPFGTTVAYVIPAEIPNDMDEDLFYNKLLMASKALGLKKAVCMVDFIAYNDEIYFLELTPRIGGDCLPPLIRHSCGLDTIKLALDFAENKKIKIPSFKQWETHVGLRLFAKHDGTLFNINCKKLINDSRIKEVYLKYRAGHEIVLPPEDYSSWILGHVIFEPLARQNINKQCDEILGKITIEVEEYYDKENVQLFNSIY